MATVAPSLDLVSIYKICNTKNVQNTVLTNNYNNMKKICLFPTTLFYNIVYVLEHYIHYIMYSYIRYYELYNFKTY
jgi:hypothetical protein